MGERLVCLVFEAEDSRRKSPAEDKYVENLEKYKSENQSLHLQVSELLLLNWKIVIFALLLILISFSFFHSGFVSLCSG